MSTVLSPPEVTRTVADLLHDLGDVSPSRVLLHPALGTATEEDVIRLEGSAEKRLCELIDGVLVEKAMGYTESVLALAIADCLRRFVVPRNLGIVSGESGMIKLFPRIVRIPDVAFVAWDRVPGGKMPTRPIPELVPNLAVEVLSQSNTAAEMSLKLQHYFSAGVELVCLVEP